MSKRQKVLYHIKKSRSWWSGDVTAWCGYVASSTEYGEGAFYFASWRSDYSPCLECRAARKAGKKP